MGRFLPVVSFSDLLSRIDNDGEFAEELLALFCEELPSLMRTLSEAVEQLDLKLVEMTAHTLAGMLANLSAPHAQASASVLEILARDRQIEGLASALALFRQDMDAVTESISSYRRESLV